MLKMLCAICICLVTSPAFCESAPNYQIATITEVKPHQSTGGGASDVTSYDISIKVGDTIYLVLYTPNPPLSTNTVKYAAGRGLLVLVGKKTITYHDILGRASELPIVSQKPAADAKSR